MARRFTAMGAALGGALVFLACNHTVVGTGPENASSSGAVGGSSGGGSTLVPVDTVSLCRLFVNECGSTSLTLAECVKAFSPLRATPECANQVPSATCDTLDALERSCFSSCDPAATTNQCASDGLIGRCVAGADGSGYLFTFACDAICRGTGSAYSGTCGLVGPDGDSAEDGTERCWCR